MSEDQLYQAARRRMRIPRAHDARTVALCCAVETGEESLVQQQFRDEVDVNTIVRRFGITQEAPAGLGAGVYGDFSGIHDFESAREVLARVQADFLRLRPEVREQFGNDPGRLLRETDGMSEAQWKEFVGPFEDLKEVPPVAEIVKDLKVEPAKPAE